MGKTAVPGAPPPNSYELRLAISSAGIGSSASVGRPDRSGTDAEARYR